MADWNTIVAESLNTGQPRGLIIASENPAPRPPRTGPKRPGQQLSRPWRGQARQARDDQPVADGNQLDDPPAAQQSSHAQKMQQQDEDWNRERLGLCSRALGHAPLHASMQELRLRQRQQQVEELLSAACLFHCCSTPRAEAEGVAHDQALDQLPPRQAVYYSFDHRFTIQVPRWHCKQCNIDFEPQPQDVNCWPSTVAQPFRWFDLDMMHMYKHLGLRLGVSATGFLDTCHLQQERYGAVEAAALAGGDPVPARTDSHQFMQSFMAYLGVHTDLASLTGLGLAVPDDPLSACPVCADVPADIVITNADAGIYVFSSFFITVTDITLQATSARLSAGGAPGYSGHWGIFLKTSVDCLVTDYTLSTKFIHDNAVDKFARGNVFSRGSGLDLNMDMHRGQTYGNLFTQINTGAGTRAFANGGTASKGLAAGSFTSFWNVVGSQTPLQGPRETNYGPWLTFIGVKPFVYSKNKYTDSWYVESITPSDLVPPNIYLAQRDLRLSSANTVSTVLGGTGSGGVLLTTL